ncbi:SCO family protein [Alienimonas sp. DA493]|uniref:SCO family protein n=1 Tax=Alienimonas sp. DA493 TaxID=3373605 RepID=UPI0037547F96
MTRPLALAVAALCGLLCPALASAQAVRPDKPDPNVVPFEVREVGVDEKLGDQVPADLLFRDHTGNRVRLGDYFDGTRPVILTLNYSRCPKICDMQLQNLARTLGELDVTAGDDYRVVTVSIDPSEGPEVAESRRRGYVRLMGKGNWSFLTGTPASIARLARAVGFRYKYEPSTKEYHHAPVAILLTPTGRVGRYHHRLDFDPETLKLGLIETGEGTLGTTSEYFPLICYRYDPERAAYVPRVAEMLMAGAGFLFVVGFGGWLSWQWRRSRAASSDREGGSGENSRVRREDARSGGPVNAPAAV